MPREAAPEEFTVLFEAAAAIDAAQSDIVELTGIRHLASKTEALILSGAERDCPGLKDLSRHVNSLLPEDLENFDETVNMAAALPRAAGSHPRHPWEMMEDEVNFLQQLQAAARDQEAANARDAGKAP